MRQAMIEGNAPRRSVWAQRVKSPMWLMGAFFLSFWTLVLLFSNQPKPRATPGMRARLEPIYALLQQREEDARADHPQANTEDSPSGFFPMAHLWSALPRHTPKGDQQAVDSLMSYGGWVDSVEANHSAAKRAELDDSDRKQEAKMHRRLTSDFETRMSPRLVYAPPQWFFDYPFVFAIPALLFPAIFVAAFGPTVLDGMRRRRLKRVGVPMAGTVLSAEATGVSINRVPQLLLRVRLETGEQAEYRKLSLYGFGIGVGTQVQLLVDPRDHTKVTEA